MLAPIVGLTAGWLVLAGPSLVTAFADLLFPRSIPPSAAFAHSVGGFIVWLMLFGMLFFGGMIGFFVELVLVTPLLIGYQRHRWAWLNGWSAVGLGSLVGLLSASATLGFAPPGLHGKTAVSPYHYNLVVGLSGAAAGAVSALILRLMAVRLVAPSSANAEDVG
jgi:hypothetical protein